MKTIFFLDKQIHLTINSEAITPTKNVSVKEIFSREDMDSAFKEVVNHMASTFYFTNNNIELLFDWFSSLFSIVSAAGGLVKNKNNEYLFIFRNGKWDLPKGKIESGETIEKAAVREVEEECGIGQLTITETLPTTYHIYEYKGKMVLKPTYWFAMNCTDTSELTPQLEEGITAVEWIAPHQIDKVLNNTYDALREMIEGVKIIN